VGDSVLLKLQSYVQQSVASRSFPKLAFKFYGPFNVTEKIGAAAYSLFGWLVADGWCWFVLREEYCWLVAGG
jgi:hypothetical protein